MVEIGGKPILLHVMKINSVFGITDFVIYLGYRGYVAKERFPGYYLYNSDVTFDLQHNSVKVHQVFVKPWTVTLVDSGESATIGSRIKRILPFVANDSNFCLTYGDGVGDVHNTKVVAFHRTEVPLAAVTTTEAPGRFVALECEGRGVAGFREKPFGMAGGSMAASSSFRSRLVHISRVTKRVSNVSRWNGLLPIISSPSITIGPSGSPWIRCPTLPILKAFGRAARHPGNSGGSDAKIHACTDHRQSWLRWLRASAASARRISGSGTHRL